VHSEGSIRPHSTAATDSGCHSSPDAMVPAVRITVVICTRNRPSDIIRATRSVGLNTTDDVELIVVDQSDEYDEGLFDGTGVVGRVQHLGIPAVGKPSALNVGLRAANAPVVVVIDDDCEVSAGWVAGMAQALDSRPDVALVFSRVVAGPHDSARGYIPTFDCIDDRLVRSIMATTRRRGLGAGMAMRRDAVLAIGGCDETIGPGTQFLSGDDWDLELRLLLHGWQVYEWTGLAVVHHGFRSFAEGREHSHRNWYGMGAVCAKPVRAGHGSGLVIAVWQITVNVLWAQIRMIARGHRPVGLRRIPAFCRGFARGLLTPVDRGTLKYRPRAAIRV
jgi:GT2 family glycosyltransferase